LTILVIWSIILTELSDLLEMTSIKEDKDAPTGIFGFRAKMLEIDRTRATAALQVFL
jgi:hypothetical protein